MAAVTENLQLRMKRLLEAMRPLEEREAQAKQLSKAAAADAYIEVFTKEQSEDLEKMRELFAKYEAEARQRALDGEEIHGIALSTQKKVTIDLRAAVQWAIDTHRDNWLTLTDDAMCEISDAVKNRVFEVPVEVAQYSEEKSTKLYKDKILNGN